MIDIVLIILLIVFVLASLYAVYVPEFEIVEVGYKRYRLAVWYFRKGIHTRENRVYKLL